MPVVGDVVEVPVTNEGSQSPTAVVGVVVKVMKNAEDVELVAVDIGPGFRVSEESRDDANETVLEWCRADALKPLNCNVPPSSAGITAAGQVSAPSEVKHVRRVSFQSNLSLDTEVGTNAVRGDAISAEERSLRGAEAVFSGVTHPIVAVTRWHSVAHTLLFLTFVSMSIAAHILTVLRDEGKISNRSTWVLPFRFLAPLPIFMEVCRTFAVVIAVATPRVKRLTHKPKNILFLIIVVVVLITTVETIARHQRELQQVIRTSNTTTAGEESDSAIWRFFRASPSSAGGIGKAVLAQREVVLKVIMNHHKWVPCVIDGILWTVGLLCIPGLLFR